ncbi:MAG: hypothetical protein HYV63_20000 [Candidatus Schekmanbacteria bacterium]|nr:hypothetical protein [Candidatus Schekmanbacteria bacterium]
MSKARLKVVCDANQKLPFMRGILTHSLLTRGMSFEQAHRIANSVRNRLRDTDKVTTAALRKIVDDEIVAAYGAPVLQGLRETVADTPKTIGIRSAGAIVPFSKGLLARSITGAGIDPSEAYAMARDFELSLRAEGILEIEADTLSKRVFERIREQFGKDAAEHYNLAVRIDRLDRPVIIYLGGAGGTGKSTLATELASRLGIMKVSGTDIIRQIMRIVFTDAILPALHSSSYNAGSLEEFATIGSSEADRVLAGFTHQAAKVCVGVRAVVERAIAENMNLIIEGVHLVPALLAWPDLKDKAYHIPVVLSVADRVTHRTRLQRRTRAHRVRQNPGGLSDFHRIRLINDYFVAVADQLNMDIINNDDFDTAINELVHTVIHSLQEKVKRNTG